MSSIFNKRVLAVMLAALLVLGSCRTTLLVRAEEGSGSADQSVSGGETGDNDSSVSGNDTGDNSSSVSGNDSENPSPENQDTTKTYTVTYRLRESLYDWGEVYATREVKEGEYAPDLEVPEKEGIGFSGWSSYIMSNPITKDCQVYGSYYSFNVRQTSYLRDPFYHNVTLHSAWTAQGVSLSALGEEAEESARTQAESIQKDLGSIVTGLGIKTDLTKGDAIFIGQFAFTFDVSGVIGKTVSVNLDEWGNYSKEGVLWDYDEDGYADYYFALVSHMKSDGTWEMMPSIARISTDGLISFSFDSYSPILVQVIYIGGAGADISSAQFKLPTETPDSTEQTKAESETETKTETADASGQEDEEEELPSSDGSKRVLSENPNGEVVVSETLADKSAVVETTKNQSGDLHINIFHQTPGLGTRVNISSSVGIKNADGTSSTFNVETLRTYVKASDVSAEEKRLIANPSNSSAKGLKVLNDNPYVLDISLFDGDNKINELTGEITFTINVPENAGINFALPVAVVRIHDGKAEILDTQKIENEPRAYQFKTDKFSTYAVVNVAHLSPKTGQDSGSLWGLWTVCALGILGAGITLKVWKKRA